MHRSSLVAASITTAAVGSNLPSEIQIAQRHVALEERMKKCANLQLRQKFLTKFLTREQYMASLHSLIRNCETRDFMGELFGDCPESNDTSEQLPVRLTALHIKSTAPFIEETHEDPIELPGREDLGEPEFIERPLETLIDDPAVVAIQEKNEELFSIETARGQEDDEIFEFSEIQPDQLADAEKKKKENTPEPIYETLVPKFVEKIENLSERRNQLFAALCALRF